VESSRPVPIGRRHSEDGAQPGEPVVISDSHSVNERQMVDPRDGRIDAAEVGVEQQRW